jgi:hypothetical protein
MKPECEDIAEDHLGSFFDAAQAYPDRSWNMKDVLDHFKEYDPDTDIDTLFEIDDRRGLAAKIDSASFVSRASLTGDWAEATRWKADGGSAAPQSMEI